MKYITYQHINLIGIEYTKIVDLQIEHKLGEHASAVLIVETKNDVEKEDTHIGKRIDICYILEGEKEYIVNTLGKFTLLAGKALSEDSELKLDEGQAVFITQIIAEWSFHKSIDLVHSGILPQYWDDIMQKIAYTIFEIAKQAVIRKIPQDQLLKAVEHHVNNVYKQSIEELAQKGVIDEEVKNRAESQSNIDAMAQQVQAEQQRSMQDKAAESVKNAEEAQRRREESDRILREA